MPTEFREEFLRQFNGSMSKFIALAEAMPEDRYSWSPGEGVLPVAQVYAHVARYNFMYPEMSMNISAPAGVRLDTLEQVARKADVVALLVRSRDHVRQLTRDIPDARLSQPHRVVRT